MSSTIKIGVLVYQILVNENAILDWEQDYGHITVVKSVRYGVYSYES